MCVCDTITSERLEVESSFLFLRLHLEGIQVKFVYEGHRVKVKVTTAGKREIPCLRSINLESAVTPVL